MSKNYGDLSTWAYFPGISSLLLPFCSFDPLLLSFPLGETLRWQAVNATPPHRDSRELRGQGSGDFGSAASFQDGQPLMEELEENPLLSEGRLTLPTGLAPRLGPSQSPGGDEGLPTHPGQVLGKEETLIKSHKLYTKLRPLRPLSTFRHLLGPPSLSSLRSIVSLAPASP